MIFEGRRECLYNLSWRGNPLPDHNHLACCSSLQRDAFPEPPFWHSPLLFSVAKSGSSLLLPVGRWCSHLPIAVDTLFGVLVKASSCRTDRLFTRTLCFGWVTLTAFLQRQWMLNNCWPYRLLADLLFDMIFFGRYDQLPEKGFFGIIGYAWFVLFLGRRG